MPIRVWEGDVVRYDVDPQLTADEINDLLDEIAPIAQEWIDGLTPWVNIPGVSREDIDGDAGFKIQEICERRVTESGGVWDAKQWIEADGLNPALSDGPFFPPVAKEINLRHDSSDADLDEIAEVLRESAADEGLITLVNLDEYLIEQREILRAQMQEV